MEFEVTTDYRIVNQETGEPKPSDEWTENDHRWASEVMYDELHDTIAVPFTNTTASGAPIRPGDQDGLATQTHTISVEEAEIATRIDPEQSPLLDGETVTFDTERLGQSVFHFEGEVFGKAGRQNQLRTKLLRNTMFDELSYFDLQIDRESHSPADDTNDKWLRFVAEVSLTDYLVAVGSVPQYNSAIQANDLADVVWAGWN